MAFQGLVTCTDGTAVYAGANGPQGTGKDAEKKNAGKPCLGQHSQPSGLQPG